MISLSLSQALVAASLVISLILLMGQRKTARSIRRWNRIVDQFKKSGGGQIDPQYMTQLVQIETQMKASLWSFSKGDYLAMFAIIALQVLSIFAESLPF